MTKIVIIVVGFVLVFLGSLQYLSISQSIINLNQATLKVAFSWQPQLYAFIFSIQVLVSIIIFVKRSAWKRLTLILFVNVLVGFTINLLVLNWVSQYQLDPAIANTFTLQYKGFFLMPTLFMLPVVFINALKLVNYRRWLEKIQFLKNWDTDIRLKRFLGNIVDILICYGIGSLFTLWLYSWSPYSFLAVYFLYKYILEATTQTTLGKNLFQLYIQSSNNKVLEPWRFLVRNLCRIIPLYSVPILFEKPGFHEILSNTRVFVSNLPTSVSSNKN